MKIPDHIAARIREEVSTKSTVGLHLDSQAARYGGIGLVGTIGSVWLLRPDGTLWDVDDDFGLPLRPLGEENHIPAIVWGRERYPWLSELLPIRGAVEPDCSDCKGTGRFEIGGQSPPGTFVLCPACVGLGWRRSQE